MATGWWRGLPRLDGVIRWVRGGTRAAGQKAERGRSGDGEPPGRSPASGEAAGGEAAGGEAADHETAELTANFWRVYDQRMATVRFKDVARRFPALIGQAVSLGWSANRRDTAATIALNLVSGVFGGYALFATSGVLEALFA